MSGARTGLGRLVLALAALAGCEGSGLAPGATVRVEGRLLGEDGRARIGATVPLFRGGARAASGACLLVESAAAGPYREARAGDDGSYRFELAGDETQTSTTLGDADRAHTPGRLARCLEVANLGAGGRRAVVDFSAQSESIDVPELRLWDDATRAEPAAGGTALRWSPAASASQRVEVWSGEVRVWAQAVAPGAGEALLPAYVLEDLAGAEAQLAARSESEGSGTTFVTTRTGARVAAGAGAGAPLSRGAACDASSPCRLTDGAFGNALARPAASVTVTLAEPAAPSRLLLRGLSGPAGVVVESSPDGATFTEVGRLESAGAFAEVPLSGGPALAFRVRPLEAGAQLETLAEVSLVR